MQAAKRRSKPNNTLIYVVIAVVLLVMVVAGVRWAKDRANYYYGQISTTSEEAKPTDEPEPPVAPSPSSSSSDHKKESSHRALPNSSGVLPSAGPEDYLLPILALSVLAFAGIKFLQARRRLLTIR